MALRRPQPDHGLYRPVRRRAEDVTHEFCGDRSAERAVFSPDGEQVVTVGAYAPARAINVCDRDLELVRAIRLPEGQVATGHAWTDDGPSSWS